MSSGPTVLNCLCTSNSSENSFEDATVYPLSSKLCTSQIYKKVNVTTSIVVQSKVHDQNSNHAYFHETFKFFSKKGSLFGQRRAFFAEKQLKFAKNHESFPHCLRLSQHVGVEFLGNFNFAVLGFLKYTLPKFFSR